MQTTRARENSTPKRETDGATLSEGATALVATLEQRSPDSTANQECLQQHHAKNTIDVNHLPAVVSSVRIAIQNDGRNERIRGALATVVAIIPDSY